MFCSQSQTNFKTDEVLQDSLGKFYVSYQTDSTTVTWRDSIYKYERVEKLKCKETDSFENNGFRCWCAK